MIIKNEIMGKDYKIKNPNKKDLQFLYKRFKCKRTVFIKLFRVNKCKINRS